MARDAYTYLHVVLVAGIIVSAVGDELVIAHPSEPLADAEVAAVVAGPAIYLLAPRAVPPAPHRHGELAPARRARAACVARRASSPSDADALVLALIVLARARRR